MRVSVHDEGLVQVGISRRSAPTVRRRIRRPALEPSSSTPVDCCGQDRHSHGDHETPPGRPQLHTPTEPAQPANAERGHVPTGAESLPLTSLGGRPIGLDWRARTPASHQFQCDRQSVMASICTPRHQPHADVLQHGGSRRRRPAAQQHDAVPHPEFLHRPAGRIPAAHLSGRNGRCRAGPVRLDPCARPMSA